MALTIQQDQHYAGDDYWHWSVWLDGAAEELDTVEQVQYILHPTFPNPVRLISDRSTNFRLETSGWGIFTIHARIKHRHGDETQLHHELVLLYPDGTPTLA